MGRLHRSDIVRSECMTTSIVESDREDKTKNTPEESGWTAGKSSTKIPKAELHVTSVQRAHCLPRTDPDGAVGIWCGRSRSRWRSPVDLCMNDSSRRTTFDTHQFHTVRTQDSDSLSHDRHWLRDRHEESRFEEPHSASPLNRF